MLPYRGGIAQIVVLLDQVIKELFLRRPSDLSQFDWGKVCQGSSDWRWTKIESRLGCLPSSLRVIVVVNNPWRKSYQVVSLKLEQKTAADAIFELAVCLAPVPCLAELAGDEAATFASIVVNDLADETEIVLGNIPFAVGEKNVHENERNRL